MSTNKPIFAKFSHENNYYLARVTETVAAAYNLLSNNAFLFYTRLTTVSRVGSSWQLYALVASEHSESA